jgi:hypothetical protein
MKKLILGLAATAAVAVAAPGLARADVSTNDTANDAYGYCIANHIANFNQGFNGIGHLRSQLSGQAISGSAGNRAPAVCTASQGDFAPISNNG